MKTLPPTLPFRVAQPRHSSLEYMTDGYFEMLSRCGCDGLYLQMSPFDSYSGNFHSFWDNYHLIYLYDIIRGPQKEGYQDYINTVCERAGKHGLNTYLHLWEPRLPFAAWSETPPHWRGRGGYMRRDLNNHIAFCWSEPDAVAYWRAMCLDAFEAVPKVKGVYMGMIDNEALPCGTDCPKCKGEKQAEMARGVYDALLEVKARREQRGDAFRITMMSWWMPEEVIRDVAQRMNGQDIYVVGHSSQGLGQVIDGETVHGLIGDTTQILPGAGPVIKDLKAQADKLDMKVVDMISWSHPMESWWLPAAPNPRYAWGKMKALREAGVEGWCDHACASLEPGSISETVALLTREPDLDLDETRERVLQEIFGEDDLKAAVEAYKQFNEGENYFPIALDPPEYDALSFRVCGLGVILFGPFVQGDMTFIDTGHYPRNAFAPYLFLTEETLPHYSKHLPKGAAILEKAWRRIQTCKADTPAARREKDAFEIHYRHFRAISNYAQFGQAHYDFVHQRTGRDEYQETIARIARDELENTDGLSEWIVRNPTELGNPCWDLYGMLEDCWPGLEFRTAMLQPKKDSLQALINGTSYPIAVGKTQRERAMWSPPYGKIASPWNYKVTP